jgi:hypothetical protein
VVIKNLIPFILLLGLNSFANHPDCEPVNLFDNPNYKKAQKTSEMSKFWRGYNKQIPLYDQGDTGICYAFTAAQMVDYWRITKGTRVVRDIHLSTPLYAAFLTRELESSIDYQEETFETGQVGEALMAIKKYGMCSPDIIEKALQKFAGERNIDPREFYEIVQLLYSKYPKGIDDTDKFIKKYSKTLLKLERDPNIRSSMSGKLLNP